MKFSYRTGTVSLIPVVAVVLSVAAFSVLTYYALPTLKKEAATNTNTTVNTNVAYNANGSSNTNAATNTSVTTDETKDWKTYTNSKYNINFKYPSNWTVAEGGTTTPYKIDIYPKTSNGWSTTSAITFWIGSAYSLKCGENPVTTTSRATIGTIPTTLSAVYDKKVAACKFRTYLLQETPVGWTSLANGGKNEIQVMSDDQGNFTIQDEILATLKLTSPTADWKTFTNTKYLYTFRLTPDWKPLSELDGSVIPGITHAGNSYLFGKPGSKGSFGFTVSAVTMDKIVEGYPNTLKQWYENKSIRSEEDVALGSATFKKITLTDDPTTWYLSEHGQYLYEIRVQEAPSTVVDQMLSTFTFTK